jgi:hypothetical protein
MEVAELFVLVGYGHALEIGVIADSLKVTTDQKKINLILVPVL